jgi:formylglycine-generating enzyme required for sulfatase activity
MEMARIPAGSVRVSQFNYDPGFSFTARYDYNVSAFYIGKYEVTQAQYNTVMGTNPSSFTSGADTGEVQTKRPVENVTWYDAVEFCNKLSDLEGLTKVYTINNRTPSTANTYPITSATVTQNMNNNGYRLPTEIEWQYASSNGNFTEAGRLTYAWFSSNSNSKTHEVGKKLANNWGLYDVLGNVAEWCWDWYAAYSSPSNSTDIVGPSSGTNKIKRGSNYSLPYASASSNNNDDLMIYLTTGRVWGFSPSNSTDNSTNRMSPSIRNDQTGFRVVRR